MEVTYSTSHKSSLLTDGVTITNSEGLEEVIQIPYNTKNTLITEKQLIEILSNYNVTLDKINHLKYFWQAFTHPSYIRKDVYPDSALIEAKQEINSKKLVELRDRSYERLEYFGDRVVKLSVSMYLFYRYPDQDEGFMTRLQTKLEDKKNLSAMSMKVGLGKYFLISKQIEDINGRKFEKIHEDVFEAFLGALFLSNGLEPCILFLINLLETIIDYSDKLYRDNNYKDRLLRYYHEQKWGFPKYYQIHSNGPAHKRTFIMGVQKPDALSTDNLKDKGYGFGISNSKKGGEQKAAKMVLILMKVLKDDQYVDDDIYYPNWSDVGIEETEIEPLKNQMIDMMDDESTEIDDLSSETESDD